MENTERLSHALSLLCEEADRRVAYFVRADLEDNPKSSTSLREVLGYALIANSAPLSNTLLDAIDAAVAADPAPPPLTPTPVTLPDALWLRSGPVRVAVWRGDICRLEVDAVVNAANDAGLGCFQPSHRCIDNVLHRAAGPRLREECRVRMAERDEPLAAGAAPLLTAGYRLPARHVLHVTGPQLLMRGAAPTAEQARALAACYTGCLDRAAAAGLRSVAFCCISTGLFGYPQDAAAELALTTVVAWCSRRAERGAPLLDLILFDTFTEQDTALYTALAPRHLEVEQKPDEVECVDCDSGRGGAGAGAPPPSASAME